VCLRSDGGACTHTHTHTSHTQTHTHTQRACHTSFLCAPPCRALSFSFSLTQKKQVDMLVGDIYGGDYSR
jgi:hypothetical protein